MIAPAWDRSPLPVAPASPTDTAKTNVCMLFGCPSPSVNGTPNEIGVPAGITGTPPLVEPSVSLNVTPSVGDSGAMRSKF